ncbi:MAG TPA: DUF4190 domain-containing protein [Candidatus Dormibacteraeota bacterium]
MAQTGPATPLPVPPPVAATAGGAVTGPKTNDMAIVSLVAGIAGYLIPHPFIAGIVAVVTGHTARSQIKRTGEGGAGLALAGLILGYVHLALSILLTILVVLFLVGLVVLTAHGVTTH